MHLMEVPRQTDSRRSLYCNPQQCSKVGIPSRTRAPLLFGARRLGTCTWASGNERGTWGGEKRMRIPCTPACGKDCFARGGSTRVGPYLVVDVVGVFALVALLVLHSRRRMQKSASFAGLWCQCKMQDDRARLYLFAPRRAHGHLQDVLSDFHRAGVARDRSRKHRVRRCGVRSPYAVSPCDRSV